MIDFNGSYRDLYVRLFHQTYGQLPRRRPEEEVYWETTEGQERIQYLIGLLNERAPEGHYFGVHPRYPFTYKFWRKSA